MSIFSILFVLFMASAAFFAGAGMWAIAVICFILAGVSEAIAYIGYMRLKGRVEELERILKDYSF